MFLVCLTETSAAQNLTADELIGVWGEKRVLGPHVSGVLDIHCDASSGRAEIGGHVSVVQRDGADISFDLANAQGGFRGRIEGDNLRGHWIQPRTMAYGTIYATPVAFSILSAGHWQGEVHPLEDAMTFYLAVGYDEDSNLTAYFRNPERNAGRFMTVERIAIDSNTVTFLSGSGDTVAEGQYSPDDQCLSVFLPWAGGTYDFNKNTAEQLGEFRPRQSDQELHTYAPPPSLPDGWPVATLGDVEISSDSIGKFIRMLSEMPMESIHSLDLHGILIARRGRLVLEEYFHGYHRNEPHDTRSASKTVTSTLMGAAILRGYPLDESTPVYATMIGADSAQTLDPRKRALTAGHLLTMSSGLDCDDSDQESPGNEDTMQEQKQEPDWVQYTMDLDMIRDPGVRAVYCSCNPNLLGGVLARATGKWIPELFDELIAEPMHFGHYALNLMPNREGYMGGGARLLPRDFLKLGQMMLDEGKWNGKQIVSRKWAERASSRSVEIEGHGYGYYWWNVTYPYDGDSVTAFFAGGNGGQIVMVIPKLEMVLAFFGGNYSDMVYLTPQRKYVPNYIIPAIIR
jgi:CubicO group peptidase (beta-lactamase class C family)